MLSSLMIENNFGLHHGQLTALLRTWEKLFITINTINTGTVNAPQELKE